VLAEEDDERRGEEMKQRGVIVEEVPIR